MRYHVLINALISAFDSCMIAYVLLVQAIFSVFLLYSMRNLRFHSYRMKIKELILKNGQGIFPPVSLIVPAYNEEATIVESIKALLRTRYPKFEIIVVNDGSKDRTTQVLKDAFEMVEIYYNYIKHLETKSIVQVYQSLLHPNVILVDKENGGKADAINAGINISRYPLFCVIDADSLLEPDAVLNVVYPFIESRDEVVATGGIVRIANGCTVQDGKIVEVRLPENYWAKMQVLEYLRAFLIGRLGLSEINSLLIIAGAFGVFRKSAVIEIGGYLTETVGEDMELTVRLQRYRYEHQKNWRIMFVPDPVCWTLAPEDHETLKRQRHRWHRGLIETLWRHRVMFFNPRYGIVGMFGMAYFVLIESIGPLVELAGLGFIVLAYLIGNLNVKLGALFYAANFVFGQFISFFSMLLEYREFHRYDVRELGKLVYLSFFENVTFHLLTAWWRCVATFQVRKYSKQWGDMKRRSFEESKVHTPS
ncbi:MAG: glycosyltransferase family 2 protein [Alicyclobacillus herbarius]|uniref:glycosyltransferase family 2 protein n=1 Tax=Alicyclobacillus herbarius TaxID=122960 RepID=UPI002353AF91|nr:glycosyltransferase family 2 protein [Alicyclobacillus herbarius]MCL6633534.1 glycosyltransferase family 2 protein [Alicyclobacillus herbarius]